MGLPGYDTWKTETPEDERERIFGKSLCPFCGAYSTDRCELEEETEGNCPWEMSQPDPDDLLEQRREDERMDRELPRGWDD